MFKSDSYNQTEFSAEEPLYEKVRSPEKPAEPMPEEEVAVAPKDNKKKKILIASGIIFASFLIIISVLMSGGGTTSESKLNPTPTPEAVDTRTPMQARLEELQAELREADPNQQPLLFPSMDYNISLGSSDG